MKYEFYEAYRYLFVNTFNRLRRTIRIKLKAIRYCKRYMYKEVNQSQLMTSKMRMVDIQNMKGEQLIQELHKE